MNRVLRTHVLLLVLALGAVFVAACGGGGASTPSGTGQRITDPGKVPSSTPVQDATLFRIRGDVISTSGGVSGTVSPIAGGTATGARTYTVKSGDTCTAIAAAFKVTLEDLLRANRTIDANCGNLRVGDTLRIPGATPTAGAGGATPTPRPGAAKEYIVKSGDTCGAIAANQGIDVAKLTAANPGINCNTLQIGQVVKIP